MNGLPNNETRPEFLIDTMVRGLVRWLRFLGYKAWDAGTLNDAKTIIQKNPKIILLTCSKSHLEQIQPTRYMLLLEDHLENQLHKLNYEFGIFRDIHLLSICSFCNIEVKSVDKSEIEKNIPERVAENYEIFRQCPECKRVYWQGGHIIRLKDKLRRMNIPISDFDSPNSKP
ncbi:MAG: hypothetical protein JSW33_10515 [bacterium]|nr:MAG: hypothetical protein JSW33_10515 [bacterium]